jgi:hypothetical protein
MGLAISAGWFGTGREQIRVRQGECQTQEGEVFFFEKKNQKTFVY